MGNSKALSLFTVADIMATMLTKVSNQVGARTTSRQAGLCWREVGARRSYHGVEQVFKHGGSVRATTGVHR